MSAGIAMGVPNWATTSEGKPIGRSPSTGKKLNRLMERKDFSDRQLSRRPKQKDDENKSNHAETISSRADCDQIRSNQSTLYGTLDRL